METCFVCGEVVCNCACKSTVKQDFDLLYGYNLRITRWSSKWNADGFETVDKNLPLEVGVFTKKKERVEDPFSEDGSFTEVEEEIIVTRLLLKLDYRSSWNDGMLRYDLLTYSEGVEKWYASCKKPEDVIIHKPELKCWILVRAVGKVGESMPRVQGKKILSNIPQEIDPGFLTMKVFYKNLRTEHTLYIKYNATKITVEEKGRNCKSGGKYGAVVCKNGKIRLWTKSCNRFVTAKPQSLPTQMKCIFWSWVREISLKGDDYKSYKLTVRIPFWEKHGISSETWEKFLKGCHPNMGYYHLGHNFFGKALGTQREYALALLGSSTKSALRLLNDIENLWPVCVNIDDIKPVYQEIGYRKEVFEALGFCNLNPDILAFIKAVPSNFKWEGGGDSWIVSDSVRMWKDLGRFPITQTTWKTLHDRAVEIQQEHLLQEKLLLEAGTDSEYHWKFYAEEEGISIRTPKNYSEVIVWGEMQKHCIAMYRKMPSTCLLEVKSLDFPVAHLMLEKHGFSEDEKVVWKWVQMFHKNNNPCPQELKTPVEKLLLSNGVSLYKHDKILHSEKGVGIVKVNTPVKVVERQNLYRGNRAPRAILEDLEDPFG